MFVLIVTAVKSCSVQMYAFCFEHPKCMVPAHPLHVFNVRLVSSAKTEISEKNHMLIFGYSDEVRLSRILADCVGDTSTFSQ